MRAVTTSVHRLIHLPLNDLRLRGNTACFSRPTVRRSRVQFAPPQPNDLVPAAAGQPASLSSRISTSMIANETLARVLPSYAPTAWTGRIRPRAVESKAGKAIFVGFVGDCPRKRPSARREWPFRGRISAGSGRNRGSDQRSGNNGQRAGFAMTDPWILALTIRGRSSRDRGLLESQIGPERSTRTEHTEPIAASSAICESTVYLVHEIGDAFPLLPCRTVRQTVPVGIGAD